MAVAVQLDDQQLPRAVEVGDVVAEGLLTGEFLRQSGEELVPKLSLRGRRFAAQLASP
jgi:hypothetical protein